MGGLQLAVSVSLFIALSVTPLSSACGTDVDLGGAIDGSVALDASPPLGVDCDPCARASDCVTGSTCGVVSGDLYCAKLCTDTDDCATGETCATLATPDAGTTKACVPSTGACPPAPSPAAPDGAPFEQCGTEVGPTVPGNCRACGSSSTDCAANGCYGGYWCDTAIHDCQKPPKTCD